MSFFHHTIHKETVELDSFDKKILNILQRNNRITMQELAKAVNLSVPPCQKRVVKLRESGVILSDVSVVDINRVGKVLSVFMHMHLNEHTKEVFSDLKSIIDARDEVSQMHVVSGSSDVLLALHVRDMDHYNTFLVEVISEKSYIRSFESSFSLATVKNTSYLDLETLI